MPQRPMKHAAGRREAPRLAAAPAQPGPGAHACRSLQWPLVDFVLRHAQVKTNVCTRQKWETGYRLAPRTVRDYNLLYLTRGRVVWEVEGKALQMTPGTLVIVPPAVGHRAYSLTQRLTFVSVHLEVTLPGGQDVFELLTPPRRQQVMPGSRLDAYLRGALEEFAREEDTQALLMLPAWGRLVALELLRDNGGRGLLEARSMNPLVAQLLDELRHRLRQPTTLEDLARWAGYSPQHLNRVFQRELGVTPLKYLMRMRLDESASLLAEGRLTVTAVAQQLGFPDVCYFTRLFTQRFRQTPARYRDGGSDGRRDA